MNTRAETGPAKAAPSETGVTTAPARARVPHIQQMSEMECGAASLSMVLASYGKWVTMLDVRQACGISRDGATALDLVQAARSYGLQAEGHLGGPDRLNGVTVPAILWMRQSHFVVLEGAHNDAYYLNDPASGRLTLSSEQFASEFSHVCLTLRPTDSFARSGHSFRALPELASRIRNSRTGAGFVVIAGLLAMVLGVLLAPLSQAFVNGYLGNGQEALVAGVVAALLVVGFLRGALTLLQYGVLRRLQTKLALVGSSRFLERLLRMPLAFYAQREPGDLSQRATYNIQIAQLLASQVAAAGVAVVGVIAYAALMIYYQPAIGATVVALSLANALALRLVLLRRRVAESNVIREQNTVRGTTVAAARSIETVKATGTEGSVYRSLSQQQGRYLSAQSHLVGSTALLGALPTVLGSLGAAVILVAGGVLVARGELSLGVLIALQTLALSINAPISTLMNVGSQIQTIPAALQSLDDVLDQPEDLRATGTTSAQALTGELRLHDVAFGYSRGSAPIVSGFCLDMSAGARVALVGSTGSGKSTIGNLATGLLQPWSGTVTLDGVALNDYDSKSLSGVLGKVDQTIVLFEATVRQNVCLWNPAIPVADVEAALRDAQILDDVLDRPGGIDTDVSEDGRNFSGGQRQRLEIARALATNPRILVLDEATSALDSDTEQAVDSALRARGVTCLIIAHRLSTIRDSDEIVVLGPGGSVLERGTHSTLMQARGEYFALVNEAGDGGDVGA
ncbi:MAG: cysteine peptidase family C39 domain-containing protein [Actinomycetes bacterium]